MKNRLRKTWKALAQHKKKALITFVTAGDPSLKATESIVLALEKAGADIVELGVPFSDPMADGPVIQRASERSLKKGTRLPDVLKTVRKLRRKTEIPILLMGYYNPVFHYGLERFARDAARAGVDATLIVDLPPEEAGDLDRELKKKGIALIYLLTPTSDANRIRIVARRARGFIYFVSMTGVTGAALKSDAVIRDKVHQIRRHTRLPIAVGFGISTPEQAQRIGRLGDGIVVGSALVRLIEKSARAKNLLKQVEVFVKRLRRALC